MKLAAPQQLELNCCTAFIALTSCTLAHARMPLYQWPAAERLHERPDFSLEPLHSLPNLTTLVLQGGVFLDLHGIQHLTKLQLLGAHAECSSDCLLVETLCHLHVSDGSCLARLHRHGLFACERLVHWCIKGSFVTTGPYYSSPAHPDMQHRVSPALTSLTALTCLSLHLGIRNGVNRQLTGLEYVAHLTNLKELEIGSSRHSFTVPRGISRLTMLHSLRIFSSNSAVVRLDVDWLPSQFLKRVKFGPGRYIFDEKLLRLTQIKGLSAVSVWCIPGDAHCACYFASLREHFKESAPQVKLRIHGL